MKKSQKTNNKKLFFFFKSDIDIVHFIFFFEMFWFFSEDKHETEFWTVSQVLISNQLAELSSVGRWPEIQNLINLGRIWSPP